MTYTYLHIENGKLSVVISEEKVPERDNFKDPLWNDYEATYKLLVERWLSKSTTYEVFKGEEEKFYKFTRR